jgi:Tfp pilus assembly protein PilN
MRPVNLIPVEDRRGEHTPMRSGPVVYIVVGALIAALLGVTALVLTGNQISESKAEVARLRQEDAVASARAQRLAAYTSFRGLSEQRVATVTSLADSRFDWERVMRELSRVIPPYAWLTSLTATASPDVSLGSESGGGGESGASLRASIAGPALELSGCAFTHDGVAGLIAALNDIDGVTRVGVESSALPELGSTAGTASGDGSASEGGGSDCRTFGFISEFHLVVAFDAAPVSPTGEGEEAAPAEAAPAESAPESGAAVSTPTSTEG